MYSDVSAFYYGGISEWRLCGIFSQKDIERFSSTGLDDAKKIVDRCIECNYSILCIDDELFPKCLYNIECPPALIYVNGVMPDIDNTFSIGIVGTRRATKYGIENSYRFAYALSKYGTIIVSGGALGVDGASHRGALATDGITICVRGCGLNCSYLRENIVHISGKIQILEVQFQKEVLSLQSIRLMKRRGITISLPETEL